MIHRDPDGTLYQESRFGSTRRLTRLKGEVTFADRARAAELGRKWQADHPAMAHKAALGAAEGHVRWHRQWRKAESQRADEAENTLSNLLHYGHK